MQITIEENAPSVPVVRDPAPVRTWRKEPRVQAHALVAAAYYAEKHNENMVVVQGNSYGKLIWRIARKSEGSGKYAVGFAKHDGTIPVIVVTPDRVATVARAVVTRH